MRSMYVHEINLSRTRFIVLFSVPVLGVLELKERSVVKVVFGKVGRAKKLYLMRREKLCLCVPLSCHQHVTDCCVDDLQL